MPSDKDWDYFVSVKKKLMAEHPGFYLVIKNGKMCGLYCDARATEANAPKYGSDLLIMHLDPA